MGQNDKYSGRIFKIKTISEENLIKMYDFTRFGDDSVYILVYYAYQTI
jgi:hypothetical protein